MGTLLRQNNSIAAYIREISGYGLSAQEQMTAVRNDVRERGITAEIVFFNEIDAGAAVYDKLLSSLRSQEHRFLICSSADRLDEIFDNLEESVSFLSELETLNVRFISVAEDFDTSNTKSPFNAVLQLVSAAKIVLKSERTRLGVDLARKTGKTIGRPSKQHDEEVYRLRRNGIPIRTIALQLGISTSTVQAALQRHATHPS